MTAPVEVVQQRWQQVLLQVVTQFEASALRGWTQRAPATPIRAIPRTNSFFFMIFPFRRETRIWNGQPLGRSTFKVPLDLWREAYSSAINCCRFDSYSSREMMPSSNRALSWRSRSAPDGAAPADIPGA
jgi:hypothetical protein